ncbi:MAG: JAB domain-containing protein [Chthoniobacterales bacterium]
MLRRGRGTDCSVRSGQKICSRCFCSERTRQTNTKLPLCEGDPRPSEADVRLTRRLADAARLLEIPLLDHVIIGRPGNGGPGYFSFREAGMIG